MKALEMNKLTQKNCLGPLCSNIKEVYEYLITQAKAGLQNTFILVSEKNLYDIKKDLKDNNYNVYSTHVRNSEHITVGQLTEYGSEEDLYEVEIEW